MPQALLPQPLGVAGRRAGTGGHFHATSGSFSLGVCLMALSTFSLTYCWMVSFMRAKPSAPLWIPSNRPEVWTSSLLGIFARAPANAIAFALNWLKADANTWALRLKAPSDVERGPPHLAGRPRSRRPQNG